MRGKVKVKSDFFRMELMAEQRDEFDWNEALYSRDRSQENSPVGEAGVFQDCVMWLHSGWLLQEHPLLFKVGHME